MTGASSSATTYPIDPRTRFQPRGQGFDASYTLAYERPLGDASLPEVWCYTDRLSYMPGDTVLIHASTTAGRFALEIVRDGPAQVVVDRFEISADMAPVPADMLENGCDWPVVHRWRVPRDLPTGFYLLLSRAERNGIAAEQEHGIFVRSGHAGEPGRVLLVAATCTWSAYNDWGGGNHYMTDDDPTLPFSPRLSILRPWSRGLIWLPPEAPRRAHNQPVAAGAGPRHPCFEYAYYRGYTRFYASSGWAMYERHFAQWAEREGFRLDYATQHDLHTDPSLLEGYGCVALVGHDEYWSWEMRDAVDRYVDAGGHVARFGGNYYWQVRLEAANTRQVCYKWRAATHDPVMASADRTRVTAAWEDPVVRRPGAQTMGLNGSWGVYAKIGAMTPRAPGGFTVYRPDHWCLAGTDLYYGDLLGAEAGVFGYEVDGLDYVVRDGLPYPTYSDGAPPGTEIVALGLASNREVNRGRRGERTLFTDANDPAAEVMPMRYAAGTPEALDKSTRGSGMIVTFRRGAGEVFNAGSCEWVAGLQRRDPATEQVTRNVLARFTGQQP